MYEIEQTSNITHVRHAMALFERRDLFSLEQYHCDPKNPRGSTTDGGTQDQNRTCVEAWFLGGHGNVGGSEEQDGLSLWPLQWLLSEGRKQGLVFGFESLPGVNVPNPIEYAMPDCSNGSISTRQTIPFKNGLAVDMWDLSDTFERREGMLPVVKIDVKIASIPAPQTERVASCLTVEPPDTGHCMYICPH